MPAHVIRALRASWFPALIALAALLPFLRGLVLGHAFYFRDLSRQFFPWRRFAIDGLLRGEVRYWNPFGHEGELLPLPPLSYPLDLLQLLVPHEPGFSLILALHVPLAGLGFYALVRGIGMSAVGAGAGALVYALGGFCVSSLNLYLYVQAVAWAPLAMLALSRAAVGGGRSLALAAVAVAVLVSTTGAEIVLQAVLLGLLLAAAPFSARPWVRMAAAVVLGLALAARTLAVLRDSVAGSERASGFTTSVVLAHSVHPLSLVQVLVANFHGDLSDVTRRFWARNFFPRGFPYYLSLYLGAVALALAAVGARHGGRLRARLGLAGALALFVCLGRWAGLEPLVEAVPSLRSLRYPVKAFYTVHFVAATLAAFGVHALERSRSRSAWRWLAGAALALAGLLVLPSIVPFVAPERFRWFVAGFFPPDQPWSSRIEDTWVILSDARLAGLTAAATAAVALLVLRESVSARIAGRLAVALLAADLLRSAAGVNPMVSPAFYALSPEMSRVAESLHTRRERVFTCDLDQSAGYRRVLADRLASREPHEAWSFAVLMETLTPYFNMPREVRTAYGIDLTMLVPTERVLPPVEAGCRDLEAIVGRLREAGVSRVLSVDPLHHSELELEQVVSPERIRPLSVHVYRLAGALPLAFVAKHVAARGVMGGAAAPGEGGSGSPGVTWLDDGGAGVSSATGEILSLRETPGILEIDVRAEPATALVVREAHAPGWSASLDGRPVPVVRANGRHLAVRIPSGRSRIRLAYRPPHLTGGLVLAGGAVAAVLALALVRRRKPSSAGGRSQAESGLGSGASG